MVMSNELASCPASPRLLAPTQLGSQVSTPVSSPVIDAESRSAVAVPSPPSSRTIAADTLVCKACNLDELPRTSSEILSLPKMSSFNAFVASLRAQEIR
ncbi:hypothetical protein DYB37_012618, partial [Aphanomyces astaci]